MKLRVIPNPVYLESFSAFKANPIPMTFGELYSALETRTVDGQENPYTVILSNKFYEVQKYVSATNHTFTQNIIIVSKIFWDKLSPTEQRMMREAYEESHGYQKEQTRLPPKSRSAKFRPKASIQRGPARRAGAHAKGHEARDRQISANHRPETVKKFKEEIDRVARRSSRVQIRAEGRVRSAPLLASGPGCAHGTSARSVLRLRQGRLALCLAVMVVLVFGNVVLRYGFDSGIACPRRARVGCWSG